MRDEILVDKIIQAVKILDEIDEMISTQGQELQKIDLELSDLYHFIENNNVTDDTSVKLIDRIKYLRLIRRSLQREYEIEKSYKDNSSKMMGTNSRPFLLSTIKQTVKNLNTEYKNRVLTEEDIQNLQTTEKKKRGRPPKNKVGEIDNE